MVPRAPITTLHHVGVILSEAKRSRRIRPPTAPRPWRNGFLHALRLVGMTHGGVLCITITTPHPYRCHPERSEAKSKDPYPYGTATQGKRIPPRAALGRNDTSVVRCLTKSAQHYMGVILSEAKRSRRIRSPNGSTSQGKRILRLHSALLHSAQDDTSAVRPWGNGFLYAQKLLYDCPRQSLGLEDSLRSATRLVGMTHRVEAFGFLPRWGRGMRTYVLSCVL